MKTCRIVNALYVAFPLRIFRNILIRRHMESCPACQARLVSRDEASALFVRPSDVGGIGRLWRRIEEQTEGAVPQPAAGAAARQKRAALRNRWRWAAGAATVLLTAAAAFWLLRGIEMPTGSSAAAAGRASFEINSIRAGGAPAQAFIYRPSDSDTIFVWAAKTL